MGAGHMNLFSFFKAPKAILTWETLNQMIWVLVWLEKSVMAWALVTLHMDCHNYIDSHFVSLIHQFQTIIFPTVIVL